LDIPTRAGSHSEYLRSLIAWGLVPKEVEYLVEGMLLGAMVALINDEEVEVTNVDNLLLEL